MLHERKRNTATRLAWALATLVTIVAVQAKAGSSGILALTPWDETTHSGEALDLSGYTQTFNDDFDTLSITSDRCCATWYAPMRIPTGVEHVVGPADPGDPVYLQKQPGVLTIRATRQADGSYRSGVMQTVNAYDEGWVQSKGYFEMRAKMPEGAGGWPAFFLHSRTKLAPPAAQARM